jgi:hypothetical protein
LLSQIFIYSSWVCNWYNGKLVCLLLLHSLIFTGSVKTL